MAKKIKKGFRKVLSGLLTVLGVTSIITACGGGETTDPEYGMPVPEYGVPENNYVFEGTVTGADGTPIKGIGVGVVDPNYGKKYSHYDPSFYGATTTDENGKYKLKWRCDFNQEFYIYIVDIDGEENGSYADKLIPVNFTDEDFIGNSKNGYYTDDNYKINNKNILLTDGEPGPGKAFPFANMVPRYSYFDFVLEGTVIGTDGKPVKGIKLGVLDPIRGDSETPVYLDSLIRSTITDETGNYKISWIWDNNIQYNVKIMDIDGEKNGSYKNKIVAVNFTDKDFTGHTETPDDFIEYFKSRMDEGYNGNFQIVPDSYKIKNFTISLD